VISVPILPIYFFLLGPGFENLLSVINQASQLEAKATKHKQAMNNLLSFVIIDDYFQPRKQTTRPVREPVEKNLKRKFEEECCFEEDRSNKRVRN
jgi:hypothetical protein